ncbi:hypothetical protein [Deinococcus maricopensis]|uniref:Uncharacterized protein n=1 Tax=Deinococcus maricopensis (strain DSM 21211 / LMG 22137 / NRRL B-23946 / LB-34) TaxID=709986 RepID=E8U4J3_DEIML|nr:hypothetical protein [Deinococcus maricopensis]ADV68858.1 hypothetical protein Deima_3231 [Deinococcus maricopensis DSM 21211]
MTALSLSWRNLETRVGLDALPTFHRAFLTWRGVPDADTLMLRRVQQRVEAELNRFVQAGLARREDDDVLLDPRALDGFEAARPYLLA